MNINNFYCDNPEYRQHITELATSVFRTKLREPGIDASQEDIANFMKSVEYLEERITDIVIKLSDKFGVPVQIVHSEINECVDFLPKDDLAESFRRRDTGMLH